MRNTITLILFFALALLGMAQESGNRMLVHESTGQVKGYLTDRVDSVTFAKLGDRVAADVEIVEVTLEKLTLSIQRTPACSGFKLVCLPKTMVSRFTTNAMLAAYIDQNSETIYSEDFTNGELTGVELRANSEYVVATVGMDIYGIPCEAVKKEFTTPKTPLEGNPQVTCKVESTGLYEFTLSFTPNSDCEGYAYVAGEKGMMQQQFDQFAPMMGFVNFGDMIKAWGIPTYEAAEYTWKDMSPNTEYEVFVQAWDKNGTYADYIVIPVSTQKKGGSGEAAVEITLGEYKNTEWDGVMKPSQFITYTPNDQSSCYRMNVVLAKNYDEDAEAYINDLRQDPPMPIAYWFQYETVTTDYQIDPGTEAVAIAAAKNADNKWGEVTVLRFTTPEQVQGVKKAELPSGKIGKRQEKTPTTVFEPGKLPSVVIPQGKALLINGGESK